jgi:hypothetical protein
MKYVVTVRYSLERDISIRTARNGKEAALEALETVRAWKDVQAPEVTNIKMAVQELQK